MNVKLAIKIIFVISLVGFIFSGTLSYLELFGGAKSCPAPGAAGTILGYPACVYGFFMYLLMLIVSTLALFGNKSQNPHP